MVPPRSRLASIFAIALAFASTFASFDAGAKPPRDREGAGERVKAAKRRDASDSSSSERRDSKKRGAVSIGAPNRGRLEGGVKLKPSNHLKVRAGSHAYGVTALVKLLHRVADRVAAKHKGSVLLVGDLSAKKGGHLESHNSHQSGRDADVGFYVANSRGKGVVVTKFVAFAGDGQAKEPAWARFDDARNWTLVEELLKDERTPVRYVFVPPALRTRLLRYAALKRVPKELVNRAAAAMVSPDGADVHDDDFHVRIACPESMRGACAEESAPREPVATADGATPSGEVLPVDASTTPAPEADAPAAAKASAPDVAPAAAKSEPAKSEPAPY